MGKVSGVKLPELADIADTAFTNNHCFSYAGQTRFGADSVVRVDFEPVSWLAKYIDFEGSLYLRLDGYRLVGLQSGSSPTHFAALVTRQSLRQVESPACDGSRRGSLTRSVRNCAITDRTNVRCRLSECARRRVSAPLPNDR